MEENNNLIEKLKTENEKLKKEIKDFEFYIDSYQLAFETKEYLKALEEIKEIVIKTTGKTQKISRKELIEKLNKLNAFDDIETNHIQADSLLLEYINDFEIAEAFEKLHKWYS